MARTKILLTTMFVLTLFMMCCGCAGENHERRRPEWDQNRWNREGGDRGWDRNLDRERERESESRQEERGERR